MNREIKFRVWDKLGKCKVFTGYHMFVDEEVVSINFCSRDVTVSDFGPMGEATLKFEDIELMQYTGLESKDRKEIYEGDILQWHWVNDPKQIEIDVVTYERGSFMIGKGFLGNAFVSEKFEHKVIGNIYENRELLT